MSLFICRSNSSTSLLNFSLYFLSVSLENLLFDYCNTQLYFYFAPGVHKSKKNTQADNFYCQARGEGGGRTGHPKAAAPGHVNQTIPNKLQPSLVLRLLVHVARYIRYSYLCVAGCAARVLWVRFLPKSIYSVTFKIVFIKHSTSRDPNTVYKRF
jgi:hypothetical protein